MSRSSPTNPRNRTYYAGDLRGDLIVAAVEVAAESGPSTVSLRELARRLGVSHAAPKNHFADKTALFTAIAAEAHLRLARRLDVALSELSATSPAVDRIVAAGRAYLDFARDEPGWFAVMWQEDVQDRTDPALVAASAQSFGAILSVAQDLASRDDGALGEVDPSLVALMLWSTAHGLATLSAAGALADLPGAEDPRDLEAAVLSLVPALFR